MRRLTLLAPLFLTAAAQAQPGFWLTHDPNGEFEGSVQALSQDGSIAAGVSWSDVSDPWQPGFVWTVAAGRYDFGLERGMPDHSAAFAVSSDGGTIVGRFGNSVEKPPYSTSHAYRRVGNGGLFDLGILPGFPYSFAFGVSGDGQIVVGTSETSNWWQDVYGEPFRWTAQTGMVALGHLKPGYDYTEALGISRDGTTIVGNSTSYDGLWTTEAYRWTALTGMVQLPSLPGYPADDYGAEGVNADGSVIIGWVAKDTYPYADYPVRWVNGVIEALGTLGPKGGGRMYAVDDSGNVIGGWYYDDSKYRATLCTPETGLMFLQDYLALFGIHPPEGVVLGGCLGISGDGRTFGGWVKLNKDQLGFVATIPAPCAADCDQSGQLDIDDFICFQTLFGLGDAAADCDKSGDLDFDDFTCFMTKFAAGCP